AFAVQFMLMLSIILKYFEITVSLTKHCTIFFLVQTLTTKRDIVFLIDGSDDVRNHFTALREFLATLRDFLYNVIANLAVGVNNDRISVIQYSNVPVANFYLNSFSKKEDVLSAVKGLTHRGGRPLNTGSALRYVTNNIFVTSSGSRHTEGLPQILIMLTSGKSKDNTEEPANILKNNGVSIIGIGTQNSDSNEIKNISSEKESFSVADFTYLPNIQEQVEAAIKTISLRKKDEEEKTVQDIVKCTCKKQNKHDIVFLLDGSDGTRDSFPAMRDFVQRMVDRLNVSDRRDHVSVVQFSREPEAHFYLNTYTTKESVLNTVRGLRHRGGRPLNTGAALQYVRDNVFTASAGSRRLEGVPQLLILLSGGRSFDNIDMPASSLKELGVLTFAVGSRGSDSRELQKISYDPSSALSVTDFANLPTVQEQLFSRINTVHEETKTVSPTQIGKTNLVLIHFTQSFTGLIFFKAVPNSPWYIEKSRNENVCSMQIMVT
uniref:VWFA domain-containing protein n=1 Tax=Pygocentrus nattereri TaxID=42514 RepID=A0A3B4EGC7_PYGNA